MQRSVEELAPILQLEGLKQSFHQGAREIRVLDDASVVLNPGQAVALVGPSGAGKSTLLHIAGLLETPDAGRVVVNGQDCARMNDAERTAVRRTQMGFVYQFHQLLPEFSAIENVVIPQMIRGVSVRQARKHAQELLELLGLGPRTDIDRQSFPAESSSVRRLHVRLPINRDCCSRMSRPATSILQQRVACSPILWSLSNTPVLPR